VQVFLATFRTRCRDIQSMRSRLIEPWPDIFSGHVISKSSHVLPFHSHTGSGVEKQLNREKSTQEIEGGTLKKKCWMEIKRKFDPISCLHLSISFLLSSFSWHLYILYKVRVLQERASITLFYDNSPVQSWQGIKMKSFWVFDASKYCTSSSIIPKLQYWN
jgi:hypothetical protein